MTFFTQILFDTNGNVTGKGTTEYTSIDSAEQAFHTAIASAISKAEIGKIIAIIFDEDGVVKFRRVWTRV